MNRQNAILFVSVHPLRPKLMKPRGVTAAPLLIIIGAILVFGVVALVVFSSSQEKTNSNTNTATNERFTVAYSNTELGYTFLYPTDLAVKNFTDENGRTLIFLIPEAGQENATSIARANSSAVMQATEYSEEYTPVTSITSETNEFGTSYYFFSSVGEEAGAGSEWNLIVLGSGWYISATFPAKQKSLAETVMRNFRVTLAEIQQNTNQPANANTVLNANRIETNTNGTTTNTAVSPKACAVDTDCSLLTCSGCFSNDYLETAPPDLACRTYEGYTCACLRGTCTEIPPG